MPGGDCDRGIDDGVPEVRRRRGEVVQQKGRRRRLARRRGSVDDQIAHWGRIRLQPFYSLASIMSSSSRKSGFEPGGLGEGTEPT